MNDGRLFVSGQLLRSNLNLSGSATYPVSARDTFISHQNSDRTTAERVAIVLSRRGYPCYVDTFDPEMDGDSPQLERYLRQVIGRCRALMAIVSSATKNSWWVPLEIGVALEKEKYIATYLLTEVGLPSYLWQWPMLRNDQDAIGWAQDADRYPVARMNEDWRSRTRLRRRIYAI